MSKKHKPHHSEAATVHEPAKLPVEQAEALLEEALSEPVLLGAPKPAAAREEYLVQDVHYGDLQSRLNQLAAEGRWRLHTVELSGTYCKFVVVRSV